MIFVTITHSHSIAQVCIAAAAAATLASSTTALFAQRTGEMRRRVEDTQRQSAMLAETWHKLTKQALVPHGIPMPGGRIVKSEELFERDPLPRPYVVKPVNEGSSVGVAIVTKDGNYGDPIHRDAIGPWNEFDELLAEPFIRGRELTTAVLVDKALLVTELRPKSGFYDFDAKYTDGMTDHICPAEIPDEIAEACKDIALRAHQLLGCKGTSRSDFRWDDEQGVEGLFLLEVNTQPGMTPLSLVPEQAKALDMDYGDLVEAIVADALASARKEA
jgi:D-alanine-D-alanine ligase